MASLQARHSRACASGRPWTPFDRVDGCDCQPTYYVVVRDGRRNHAERVGKNRRQAERALRKIDVQIDDGVYRPQRNIRFEKWGEQWRESLERKDTTVESYRSSIAYATEAFGEALVRRIQPAHLAKLNELLKERKLSPSTRAKHLRVVNACLGSAVEHGYAGQVPRLPKAERPRSQRKEAAYFENDELPRLFAAVRDRYSHPPEASVQASFGEGMGVVVPGASAYRVLFETALKTGMRLGELLALTWAEVDLAEKVIRVRRSYTDGHLSTPKNREQRDVDLTGDLVELLGAWWGELGRPAESTLVFPGETATGYLSATTVLRRELYPAMKRAGIPRVGPTGEKRTFHSLRHTFAKRALENGRQTTWLSRHLGHSSLAVTTEVDGHWEREERRREAELMEGVFGV
jgi:integrase